MGERGAPEHAERTREGVESTRGLGLTGPIACGKTTVGDILLELGAAERIDADRVVHALQGPGTETSARIAEAFGPDVLRPDGAVDRARLARLVFGHDEALRRLESIVHPAVRSAIREQIERLDQDGVVVIDAVKLLQSDLLPLVEEVWVVRCDSGEQQRRLTAIRGMSLEEAAGRLRAQPSFDHPRVTRIIDNSGSLDDLRAQVEHAWGEFMAAG